MRAYGKIESGFWHNSKVRPLTEGAKLLLLYIYSCQHGNSLGCFVLPDGYISADLEWSSERVSKHVSELVSKGFIERDNNTNLTKILGWFGHNTIENENVAKAAIKTIKSLPNCIVKNSLINDLNELGNKFLNKFANELGNEFLNPEPIPEPIPEPSKYRFAAIVIKLNEEDYQKFKSTYYAIPDFDAELKAADQQYAKEPASNWFIALGNRLNLKHQNLLAKNPIKKPEIRAGMGQL